MQTMWEPKLSDSCFSSLTPMFAPEHCLCDPRPRFMVSCLPEAMAKGQTCHKLQAACRCLRAWSAVLELSLVDLVLRLP